jgi:hypothetical protein
LESKWEQVTFSFKPSTPSFITREVLSILHIIMGLNQMLCMKILLEYNNKLVSIIIWFFGEGGYGVERRRGKKIAI